MNVERRSSDVLYFTRYKVDSRISLRKNISKSGRTICKITFFQGPKDSSGRAAAARAIIGKVIARRNEESNHLLVQEDQGERK
jgi:hypothetical protein